MKMYSLIKVSVLATLIFSQSGVVSAATSKSKNQAAPVAVKMTVEQIVERNVSARGGAAAWRKIQSISMSGKMDAGHERVDGGKIVSMTSPKSRKERRAEELRRITMKADEEQGGKLIRLPFSMEMKRPLKTRIEVPFQGQTAIQVYDGTHGWKLRPFLGRHEVEPFNAQEAKIASQQQELDGPLIDHKAKGIRLSLAGIEQINGKNAYKLKMTLKNGDVRNIWIDAKTFLDVRIDGEPRKMDGKFRQVTTDFHDFRTLNGVKIPYELETHVDGIMGSNKISVEHVVINPKIDDTRFTKPI